MTDPRPGTPVTFPAFPEDSGIRLRRDGVIRAIYSGYAHVQTDNGDVVSVALEDVKTWEPPYPPFTSGHGRPDLDQLYQIAFELRFQTRTIAEVRRDLEHYLANRPKETP